MGKRFLIILALLLMVRPIVLAENFTCGEETTATASSVQAIPAPIPGKEIPCSDIAQPSEIVESGHNCPCFTLMQPDTDGITTNTDQFRIFAMAVNLMETAVATPPTPPPRLV